MSRESSLPTQFKCKALGHDWYHRRERGERVCDRCNLMENYSVEETHGDKSAKKGQTRFVIVDGTLEIQRYSCTAYGSESEHWQWFPVAYGEVTDENLTELKQEIKQYLDSQSKK